MTISEINLTIKTGRFSFDEYSKIKESYNQIWQHR